MTDTAVTIARLKRKLARRDARIAGMERLSGEEPKPAPEPVIERTYLNKRTGLVRRMIPVFGQGQDCKIIGVWAMPATEPTKE